MHLSVAPRSSLSRGIRRAFLALSALVALSCATPSPPSPRGTEAAPEHHGAGTKGTAPSAVLLAIDGVRWQEVFRGVDAELADRYRLAPSARVGPRALMPNLHALARGGGVLLGAPDSGTRISATGPEFLSLPGYAEMLSGRREAGCRDNQCGATKSPTLADEISSTAGALPEAVAVVTSWPDIGRVASMRPYRLAMSTGRNGGPTRERFRRDPVNATLVDEASRVSSYPGHGDFRPDRYTARIALRYLERQRPRFLFLSLGEPDEYAHRGDYAGYLRALRHADLVIGQLGLLLGERARSGSRTLLFVTADHGRAADFVNHGRSHPESGQVFLLAWGSALAPRARTQGLGELRLADLAPTLRVMLDLAPDTEPSAGRPIVALLENPAARHDASWLRFGGGATVVER